MISVAFFGLSAALAVYIVIGYPLILGMLAKLRPKPVLKSSQLKTVSVVIAVHNGEQFIAESWIPFWPSTTPAS